MNAQSFAESRYEPALVAVLLRHLQPCLCWPGADGITIDDVLHFYASAAARGLVPGKDALVDWHPELASALEAFFADTRGDSAGTHG